MSKSFARDKGQRFERELVNLLQTVVNAIYSEAGMEPPMLERNLMQSHKGGHDLVGLDWLALEAKHQETLNINAWWDQAKRQATGNKIPVLIYKQNRVKPRVMMFGYLPAGERKVRTPVNVDLDSFMIWFREQLKQELSK